MRTLFHPVVSAFEDQSMLLLLRLLFVAENICVVTVIVFLIAS